MAQCPACATEVAVDFGMATCPQCALVFMVGIDGVTTASDEGESFGASSDESLYSADPSLNHFTESNEFLTSSVEADDGAGLTNDNNMNEVPPDGEMLFDVNAAGEEVAGDENSAQDGEYNDHFLSDMERDLSSGSEDGDEDATVVDIRDPLGVQRFDQGRASQLIDGPYYYDVTIDGLDTAEIKDQVMEVLKDPHFQWTTEDIRKRFYKGKLVLKNLNPVKAVLLIVKMQHIEVDISWTQKVYTDPSVDQQ